jgi:hypothetical protein
MRVQVTASMAGAAWERLPPTGLHSTATANPPQGSTATE